MGEQPVTQKTVFLAFCKAVRKKQNQIKETNITGRAADKVDMFDVVRAGGWIDREPQREKKIMAILFQLVNDDYLEFHSIKHKNRKGSFWKKYLYFTDKGKQAVASYRNQLNEVGK